MAQGDQRGAALTASAASITNPTNLTGSVANVAVGDLVFGVLGQQTALTAGGTVTDNLGNTYAYVNAGTDAGTCSIRCFWSRVTTGGTLTQISVPATASTNDVSGAACVIEGPFQVSPLDANPANTTDGTTPHACPPTGAMTQEPQVVMAACVVASNVTLTADGSATKTGGVARANVSCAISKQTVNSTSTVTPSFSNGAAANAGQTTASFKLVMLGTGAISLGGITVAASATQEFLSSAAVTLSTVVVAATGLQAVPPVGDGAVILAAPVLVGAGAEEFAGAGALTLIAPAIVAAGAEEFTGAGALTLTPVVLAAVGDHQLGAASGAGALPLTGAALAGIGSEEFVGAGNLSLTEPVLSGVGAAPFIGTGALTLTPVTLAGSVAEEFVGAGAVSLQAIEISATGAHVQNASGDGAIVLSAVEVSALGSHGFGPLGQGAISLDGVVVAGSAAEELIGAGAIAFEPITIAGLGIEEIAGQGAMLFAPVDIAGQGLEEFFGAADLDLVGVELAAQAASETTGGAITLDAFVIAAMGLVGEVGVAPEPSSALAASSVGNGISGHGFLESFRTGPSRRRSSSPVIRRPSFPPRRR
jgi:hypothetical protein